MDHIADTELILFSLDPAACDRRLEIETHLAECAQCCATADFMRATDEDLGDPDVWERTEGSATLRSLQAIAERIAAEDAVADELLRNLLAAPAATAWTKLHARKKYLTGGVVRRLSAEAHRVCEAEPLDALTFADAAISVAEALPDDEYPANAVYELRGTALKERANALRLLGRFDEALDSLARADRAYRHLTSSALGLSSVAYVRATVLFERQQFEEAAIVAESAERGFAHLGDDHRRMAALYLRADIKSEQHDFKTAISLFQQVLEFGESLPDAVWVARAAYALGNCYVDAGDVGEASAHFHRALLLFREGGEEAHLIRTEWGIARVLIAVGKHEEAIRRLREVTGGLESRGLVTDAALASVDAADARLALGQMRQIVDLATHVFGVFMEAGMLTSALTAMAYIKETAAAGTLTAADLDAVRNFLRRAERQPSLLFVPPHTSR